MKIFVVFVTFLTFGISNCQKNEATLYDQPDQQGDHITLSLASDLKWQQFDAKASSVCVSGLMLFYTSREFGGNVEYVYGEETYCTNLHNDKRISSVRYPGSVSDVKNESITLYSLRDFVSTDTRVYGDKFDRAYDTSLIVTGGNNWTIFDDYNFQGNSVCLVAPKPAEKTPSFLVSTSDMPDFGYIRSGKKGCDETTTNTFGLIPFAVHGP